MPEQLEQWLLLIAWACSPPDGTVCYPVTSISPVTFESYDVCKANAATWPVNLIDVTMCVRALPPHQQGWR